MNHYFLKESTILEDMDYLFYDKLSSYLKIHKPAKKSTVVVIDIDERSLSTLGQWPWPRILLADLISKLDRLNASVIGLDIIFPEVDRTSPQQISKFYSKYFDINNSLSNIPKKLYDNDKILASVIKRTNTVTSFYLTNEKDKKNTCKNLFNIPIDTNNLSLANYSNILSNNKTIQFSSKQKGFINATIDHDGVIRRASLFKRHNEYVLPNFSIAMLLSLDNNLQQLEAQHFSIMSEHIHTDKKTNILLNYYDDEWYQKVSAIDVLEGNINPNTIQGKIVIIGSSAVALHDQVIITNGKRFLGSQVHVTTIDNILNNDYLLQLDKHKNLNISFSLLATFVLLVLLFQQRNNLLLLLFFIMLLLALYATYSLSLNGLYISIMYFLVPFSLHFFIISFLYIFIDTYNRHSFTYELNKSHIALLDSMVHVAEVHDIETGAHIVRTKKYIKVLAEHLLDKGVYTQELSKEIIEMMYRTAPMHDLGKVGIPDSILKKPGKLTDIEYEVMKTHAELGVHIINNAISSYEENSFFKMARNIAHYHHEKWDGSGYPHGLKEKEIPLESRFMAIVDVYDALVSRRVYKEAFPIDKVNAIIIEGKGKHFDPLLVDGFMDIHEKFLEIAQKYTDDAV